MRVAKCDFCERIIEGNRQFTFSVYSCKTGSSNDRSGSEDEKYEWGGDLCSKCHKKIKEGLNEKDKKISSKKTKEIKRMIKCPDY